MSHQLPPLPDPTYLGGDPDFNDAVYGHTDSALTAYAELAIASVKREPQWVDPGRTVQAQVFFQEGDDPFVTSISGHATKEAIARIEQNMYEYGGAFDIFDQGDGDYMIEATYNEAEYDGPNLLCPAHYEIRVIAYRGITATTASKGAA